MKYLIYSYFDKYFIFLDVFWPAEHEYDNRFCL